MVVEHLNQPKNGTHTLRRPLPLCGGIEHFHLYLYAWDPIYNILITNHLNLSMPITHCQNHQLELEGGSFDCSNTTLK
jgi:hypothetical protein